MAEIPIDPESAELLNAYRTKIETATKYYYEKKEPAKEPEIVFDPLMQRFTKNFNAEYSGYLTRNYGVANPEEFNEKFGSLVESWNRVITRLKDGKEMTANNSEKIKQMSELGFEIETIKAQLA